MSRCEKGMYIGRTRNGLNVKKECVLEAHVRMQELRKRECVLEEVLLRPRQNVKKECVLEAKTGKDSRQPTKGMCIGGGMSRLW